MRRLISIWMIIALIGAQMSFASQIEADKMTLYYDGLISETLLKDKKVDRPVTRQEFAEIVVKLYMKINNVAFSYLSVVDEMTDSDAPYVLAAINLKLMTPTGTKFNPSGKITREQAAAVLVKVMKTSDQYTTFAKKYKNYKNATGLLALSGIIPNVSVKKGFDPKGLFLLKNEMTAIVKINQLIVTQGTTVASKTRKIGKFTAPLRSETNLNITIKDKTNLVLSFNGIFDFTKGKSSKDTHLQVIETIRSGKTFSDEDLIHLLNMMETGWDSVTKTYTFKEIQYIKNKKVLNIKPEKPYIQMDKGNLLQITVFE